MARSAEETREKIDRTALRLFAEKGVDRATINDIATEAGIAEGTIYRHYKNKEELIWGLFSSNYAALADRLDRLQEAETGLRAKLEAMVSMFCSLFEADPAMFSFLLLVQHGQLPRVTPAMPSPVNVVRKVLSRAMECGEIASCDAEPATAIVFGIVLQPAVFKVYGRIEQPLTELSGQLADACWMALKPISAGTEVRS